MLEQVYDAAKKVKEELSDQISTRSRDFLFSYFIVFEFIYNWKFVYTLFSGKDPDKVTLVITNAEGFIEIPIFFKFIYEKACEPSNFALALGSSLFMTIAYPFISSAVIFLRKILIYKSNAMMASGYPTNGEYKDLLSRNAFLEQKLEENKRERLKELGLQSNFLQSKLSNWDFFLDLNIYFVCQKEIPSFKRMRSIKKILPIYARFTR